jgi:hypothetical protein
MTSPPSISELAASINNLVQSQQTFQTNISTNLNNLVTNVNNLRARLPPPGFPFTQNHDPPPLHTTSIKLDIPRFDGSDPLGWIFKISQFFEFHHTPEDQRIRMASFYMEGEALTWYQWMHSNQQLLTWAMFVQALEMRFAPSQYEDPRGALFKLCQTGSVKEYQTAFEALANRIVGLPAPFYSAVLYPALNRRFVARYWLFNLCL